LKKINTYLTREDASFALSKMQKFHEDLKCLMDKNGFNILDNLGRRNILLSSAQEKYFSDALSRRFTVTCDGRTGEPDIVIENLSKELECKLTSKHKSGAISFQTDHDSLLKKQKLDFLYVVADRNFEKFAVVHYTDLTIKDFRPLSPGSRGKTQLKKYSAHDRANVLVGKMINLNKLNIEKLNHKISREKITSKSKIKKIKNSISYWKNCPTKFSFELESINES
jgi:hypothetical protein